MDRAGTHTENEIAGSKTQEKPRFKTSSSSLALKELSLLLLQSQSPQIIGSILAAATRDAFLHSVAPAFVDGDQAHRNFARGVRVGAKDCYHDRWRWGDFTLSLCTSASSKAWLLAMLPLSRDAWTRAEAPQVKTCSTCIGNAGRALIQILILRTWRLSSKHSCSINDRSKPSTCCRWLCTRNGRLRPAHFCCR